MNNSIKDSSREADMATQQTSSKNYPRLHEIRDLCISIQRIYDLQKEDWSQAMSLNHPQDSSHWETASLQHLCCSPTAAVQWGMHPSSEQMWESLCWNRWKEINNLLVPTKTTVALLFTSAGGELESESTPNAVIHPGVWGLGTA